MAAATDVWWPPCLFEADEADPPAGGELAGVAGLETGTGTPALDAAGGTIDAEGIEVSADDMLGLGTAAPLF